MVTPEAHVTHFDLGIAFREMGLSDDAVEEFAIVMVSASAPLQLRGNAAATVVPLLHLNGDPPQALRHLLFPM